MNTVHVTHNPARQGAVVNLQPILTSIPDRDRFNCPLSLKVYAYHVPCELHSEDGDPGKRQVVAERENET